MAHDVFISYSTKDKTIADAVCAKLEENKIRAWIAPRDIPAGANFGESIIRAINSCKVFVLIWSANTNTSNHILNEINQAFDNGITIIPFRIQDIQPTDEMRYYFGRTHWLDAIDPPLENHINTLRDTILLNLGREPYSPPPTPPPSAVEEPPQKAIQPPAEISRDKKPAVEEARLEAVKPPGASPPVHQSQKTDQETQFKVTVPVKFIKILPIAAGLFVMITLAILYFTGVFKGSPPEEVAQVSPSLSATTAPTTSSQPTSTNSPPATATPIPAWIIEANALAEPILTWIENSPPDFEDDFSEVDDGWDYWDGGGGTCAEHSTPNLNIADGSMKINIEPNCHVRIDHPFSLSLVDDFVYQADVNFSQSSNFEIGLNNDNQTNLGFSLSLGHWEFTAQKPNSEDWLVEQSGNPLIDPSTTVVFTLMKIDTKILIYVNSKLLTSYELQMGDAADLEFIVVASSGQQLDKDTLELDNVKFWDLDTFAMADTILAAIQDFPPDFADDFSEVDEAWNYSGEEGEVDQTKISIIDGTMQFTISPECPIVTFAHPDFQYPSGDYVLQVEINFRGNKNVFEFDILTYLVVFILQDGGWSMHEPDPNSDQMLVVGQGWAESHYMGPVTLTIIKTGTTFLFYQDARLLTTYEGQQVDVVESDILINVNNWGSEAEEMIEIDNIKFWDLDKIQ